MNGRCARVWIEIERPTGKEFTSDPVAYNAEADRRAKLVTNMIQRLNEGDLEGQHFWWSPNARRYCYGGPYGYRELSDDGEWFNLEHFGR